MLRPRRNRYKKADKQFQKFLQALPEEHHEMAYEFKAMARARKIKNPNQLWRLVFSYCGLDLAIREAAAVFTLLYEKITDTAVLNRLRACEPWVKAILQKMLRLPSLASDLLPAGYRLLGIDASIANGLAPKSIDFRVHLCLDLLTLDFVEILIANNKTGETLKNFSFREGDIAVVDQGYCHHPGMVHVQEQGAFTVGRLNPRSVRLLDETGQRFELLKELRAHQSHTPISFKVKFSGKGEQAPIDGVIYAQRLPRKVAARARELYRKRSKRNNKREPDALGMYLQGWILVYSTLPEGILPAEVFLSLYRLRWQVELVFKRCKSLLDLDGMRLKHDSKTANIWLYGKMLYILCLDKKFKQTLGTRWGWLTYEKEGSAWRGWSLQRWGSVHQILGSEYWREDAWEDVGEVLAERSRKRRLNHFSPSFLKKLKRLELANVLA